jgi:hypothetical protein
MKRRQDESPFSPQDMYCVLVVFRNLHLYHQHQQGHSDQEESHTSKTHHPLSGAAATISFSNFGFLVTQIACSKASLAMLSEYNDWCTTSDACPRV